MENQKNNNGLIALVIVLFLLVLGLGGYIVYDKVLSNNETPVNETTNNVPSNDDIVEEQLPEWVEYLLNQNITDITYQKGQLEYDETTGKNSCTPEKKMTKEQLKDILIKMTEADLKKYEDSGGRGGPCWIGIVVKYNNTKFEIYRNDAIFIEDNEEYIMSLFEKEKYTLVTSENKNNDTKGYYHYNWDYSYIDTLLG